MYRIMEEINVKCNNIIHVVSGLGIGCLSSCILLNGIISTAKIGYDFFNEHFTYQP